MTKVNKPNTAEDLLLDRLFELDLAEEGLDSPPGLRSRLYQIAEPQYRRRGYWASPIAAIPIAAAASVLLAVMLFSQHEASPSTLQRAQYDLALTFEYINHTQQKTEPHLTNILRQNLQRSTLQPIIKSTHAAHL